MVRCTSCGASATDNDSSCSRCGHALATHVIGANGVVLAGDQAPPLSSVSRVPATTSRAGAITVADEGRFIPGTLVAGRYRIIGLLGRGGMGEVYRATDLTLAQSVALKILPETAAANERLLERFHNEVRIARQVSHPNVCRVYDIGEADGLPFLSMEYVDGEDLASLLQRIGRLPSDKALEISRKLCAGLAAAHERGVIHRDLKPQNIMLDKRGQVVIMDFGLAAVADQLRGAEARNGTPAYMAPEQLRGDSVTLRSDIYALGLIIYELFTGRRAFDAGSVADLLRQQETSRPVSMTSLAAEIDPAVEKIIHRCLRADPAERPATALLVAAALPGGDPLAAALAAGETPSPELVASSGKTEGFPLRFAIPSLIFCLVGLIALPFVKMPMSMLAITPMDYPPPVLAQKARDIAAALGYPEKPADSKFWLEWDSDLVQFLKKRPGHNWPRDVAAAPPVDFRYRQSLSYLLSPPDGDITPERPAPDAPGMISILMDSRARLMQFRAIPGRFDSVSSEPAAPLDPAPIFRLAGLDPAAFHETAPQYAPPAAFDNRRAWAGAYPGLADTPITFEIASYRGKPTSIHMRWPWTKPVNEPPRAPTTPEIAFDTFTLLFAAAGVLSAVLLARQNLRRGRGDRQGAFRVATTQFLIFVVVSFSALHMAPRMDLAGYLIENLSFGLTIAGLVWLGYVAAEPYVRARWPHSLVTWNRSLAGKIQDPRVGSHILLGAVLGLGLRYFFTLVSRPHTMVSGAGAPEMPGLAPLLGVASLVHLLSIICFNAILTGLVMFLLLVGLRALLRFDTLAALAAALLLTLQESEFQSSDHVLRDFPLYILLFGALAMIMLRMGLVPLLTALVVINLTGSAPISSEFSAWYNYVTVVDLGIPAAIALFGFSRSVAASPAAAPA